MYADYIPKATSLLADVVAVLRLPGDEEESGTTFCFLGGRMHVFGRAAAKDLDYSQGLNLYCLLFYPSCPGNGSCPPSQPALLQRCTSQLSIFRANGLGGLQLLQGHAIGNLAP